MIVAISGSYGIETKELSKLLALQFGLKYVSRKDIKMKLAVDSNQTVEEVNEWKNAEKIKQIILGEAKKNDVIIDYPISSWILGNDASVKVFLQGSKKIKAKKIAEKEKIPLGEALEKLEVNEKAEANNVLDGFGINVYDLEIYDLIINVDKLSMDGVVELIKKYIEKMKK